ncbi:hypothetical protein D5086_015616 [Populus alba]|uniref:Uncharacterized protein n=1 Tax=Populus alba TaxID=43335 RepID=A0ACC4BS08_POPAL
MPVILWLLAHHILFCSSPIKVACHTHTTWNKESPELQVSRIILFGHECSIEIQSVVRAYPALTVHPSYCLLQFLVVELGGNIPRLTAGRRLSILISDVVKAGKS